MIVLTDGKEPLLLLAVADTIKDGSGSAIAELRALGIETVVLTGDNVQTAKAIAGQVGITTALGDQLPEDKLRVIEGYVGEGRFVGMVGDGINDASALHAADVGISVASAVDVAKEAAQSYKQYTTALERGVTAVQEQVQKLEDEERAARLRIEEQERQARLAREEEERKARQAREAEEAKLRAERQRLEDERRAAEEAARKEREAIEAKQRAEREAEEAKQKAKRDAEEARQREILRKKNELLDGREMLSAFVARFGHREEFAAIREQIADFLETVAA